MAHASRDEPLVAGVAVKLSGTSVDADMALWIINATVEDDLDLPSMFTFELISKDDEKGITAWTDDPALALGATVEISMGYADDIDSLIIGEITALEPTFSIDGPPTLIVRGYDRRHRLNTMRRSRGFLEKTDAAIAEEVCHEPHVDIRAFDSGITHEYVLQHNQTDLQFLCDRAHRIHYELAMEGKVLHFRPVNNLAPAVATMTLDDDLIEFRPRMSLVPVTEVRVLSWDAKEKQVISVSSAAGDEVSTMDGKQSSAQQAEAVFGTTVETVVQSPVANRAEADQLAVGRFNAAALDFIRADGRLRGRTDVRAGRVIRLNDLGTRFTGDYYVTSAVHRYSTRDGYLTDFRARRNAS